MFHREHLPVKVLGTGKAKTQVVVDAELVEVTLLQMAVFSPHSHGARAESSPAVFHKATDPISRAASLFHKATDPITRAPPSWPHLTLSVKAPNSKCHISSQDFNINFRSQPYTKFRLTNVCFVFLTSSTEDAIWINTKTHISMCENIKFFMFKPNLYQKHILAVTGILGQRIKLPLVMSVSHKSTSSSPDYYTHHPSPC